MMFHFGGKKNGDVLWSKWGQACLANRKIRDSLAPANHRRSRKLIGRSQEIKLYAHCPCFSNPTPCHPLTNQITRNPLPLYLSNLLVSIISNLQRNTLVYKKVFCINNYYFQTLQMKPGHNLKFHESYNFKCEAIQMKKRQKIYIYTLHWFSNGAQKNPE